MFKMITRSLAVLVVMVAVGAAVAISAEKDPLASRVPADQLADAKKMKPPFEATPDVIAKGKAVFDGKGTCFTCHGMEGKGDGPAATGLEPGPRNFTNKAFHDAKSLGEMMWVLKNGSAGTAMIPMVGSVITEEEGWQALLYERSLAK
jgi:mono/diheme cytochrome c family protein